MELLAQAKIFRILVKLRNEYIIIFGHHNIVHIYAHFTSKLYNTWVASKK